MKCLQNTKRQMPNLKNKVIKMSNWIFTQKGAVLKSEINVLFPQYVETTQRFQVVGVLKNNTSVILFENLASHDLAMVIIDKILVELDSTYKSFTVQEETPQEEIPPKPQENFKKTNGKPKVKTTKDEEIE